MRRRFLVIFAFQKVRHATQLFRSLLQCFNLLSERSLQGLLLA